MAAARSPERSHSGGACRCFKDTGERMKCPKCGTAITKPKHRCNAAKLPGILQVIAEVVDMDAAWSIAKAFGGQRVYFPAAAMLRKSPSHHLIDLLGLERAVRVAEAIVARGEFIDVPCARSALIEAKVREGRMKGLSAAQIAREAGVCRRAIQYRLSQIREEEALQQPSQVVDDRGSVSKARIRAHQRCPVAK